MPITINDVDLISTGARISGTGAPGSPLNVPNGAIDTDAIANDAVTADKLADTAVTPGSYTAANITVDAQGRITAAANGAGGGGTALNYDSLSSGNMTNLVTRLGSSAITVSSPASGEFDHTIPATVDFTRMTIFGNNTTLNGSNEMIIRLDNSANSRNRRVIVQLYDANNGALVDQQITGTVHVVAVAGNVTTITIPGLNGFGATGFYVEIA